MTPMSVRIQVVYGYLFGDLADSHAFIHSAIGFAARSGCGSRKTSLAK
jgi:hypothetical protein